MQLISKSVSFFSSKIWFFVSAFPKNHNILLSGTPLVEISDEIPRMDARFAENLVRKWQSVKSLALGPDHCFGELSEVRISSSPLHSLTQTRKMNLVSLEFFFILIFIL